MAALPKRLHIGALTFTVTEDQRLLHEARSNDLSDLQGQTDFTLARILLDPRQADCMKRDTLLHELLHVCCNTAGLADEWGPDREEQTVRRLTPHLLAAIRDNPKLLAYLTAP
jgi:hypothetical protein